MSEDGNKRTTVLLILLFIAGAGVAVYLVFAQSASTEVSPDELDGGGISGERSRPSRELDDKTPDSHESKDQPDVSAWEAMEESDASEIVPRAIVRVITKEGYPIPSVELNLRSPTGPRGPDGRGVFTSTDARGVVELELSEPSWLVVQSVDEKWGAYAKFDVDEDGVRQEIVAIPLGDIELVAVYDDGSPFIGRCMVRGVIIDPDSASGFKFSTNHQGKTGSYSRTVRFDGEGPVVLPEVPLIEDLKLTFMAHRIGYGQQPKYVERTRLGDGVRLFFTLTSDPEEVGGILEFDWTGYDADVIVTRITRPGSKMLWGGGHDQNGPPLRTELMPPGKYVLHIEGEPGWESPVFEIKARSVTRLEYQERPKSAVKIHAIDERGNSVPGALFTRNHETYMNLDRASATGEGATMTGSDGVATLREVPVGSHTFLVEARGYEPVVVSGELKEHEVCDLGVVTLAPARGSLTVNLANRDPQLSYTLMLLQPGGGTVKVLTDVKADSVSIQEIPSRKYVVAIVVGRGGRTASKSIEITPERPVQDVTLDVFGLEESSLSDE